MWFVYEEEREREEGRDGERGKEREREREREREKVGDCVDSLVSTRADQIRIVCTKALVMIHQKKTTTTNLCLFAHLA